MIKRFVIWFQARFHLSLEAVCQKSRGLGLVDYHDYPDSIVGEPWHFYTHTCKRCGKDFTI
jgi:hypothetical protein